MNTRRVAWGIIINAVVGVAILVGGWQAIAHRQDIVDWWNLLHYTPSTGISQLAQDDTMIGRGRDMFYASDPKIEDRAAFNFNCSNAAGGAGEQGSVLGCYSHQNIFVFNVTDPRLPGVKQVTAAHETLHAIYERLDGATKTRVNALLQAELDKRQSDQDLQAVIALYNKTEPGELLNEMHSILGTEYSGLSPDLETYYKQYFSNRAAVVGFAEGYKSVFAASTARIADEQTQLDNLKKQIDANNAELTQRNSDLTSQSAQLDALRQSNPAAYNKDVPPYNQKVHEYNALAQATQNLVAQYNAIVVTVNNEAALRTDLNNSLNSNYQPVTAH